MRRKMLSRVAITMLATTLLVAPLGGCNNAGNNQASIVTGNGENSAEAADDTTSADAVGAVGADENVMDYIKNNFAAAELPEDYNQPIYDLPKDYVFEFECSEEAGMLVHDAFKVYNSPKYTNVGGMRFNWNTYENGKITVAPSGALYMDETGSSNVDDGTWGSLNELYLIQYIDLETGETLERPIVTPFTIQHDLEEPIVTQSVNENSCYTLSWKAVPGAVEYRVYEHYSDYGYKIEYVTTETFATSDKFESQIEMNEYHEMILQEYEDAGYPEAVTMSDGVFVMNYAVKLNEELENGYFFVVAVGENGEQSGTSNIVDVRDIAMKIPYQIVNTSLEVDIKSVEDIPAYVEVEMVDGSIQQMIIDYHGALTYTDDNDEYKMSIRPHVANTLFKGFFVTLYGMTYEDVMAESHVISERQDELLSKLGDTQEPEMNVGYSPSEEMNEAIEQYLEEVAEEASEESSEEASEEASEEPSEEASEEPSEEPSEEISEEVSEEPSEETSEVTSDTPDDTTGAVNNPLELMNETAAQVQERIEMLGTEKVNAVMYASNDMQAWMAMCLIAQSEIIPLPMEYFSDAANLEYTASLFKEAYRQNPTSGIIANVGYSPEFQALVIEYVEEPEDRLAKAKEEIDAAFAIESEIITDDMSDYDKVLAINEYFRLNASYDFDSTETDIEDLSTLSQPFIDAHTPYGIICNNYGVCESYSEAFVLVARVAGMDAMCEFGTLYGGGHEWNRVKVDGSWCILDITNNDIEIFINALFNVTDEQVQGILVADNTAITNHQNYAANDHTKEYYYMNGQSVTDLSQADEVIAEILETSDCAVIRIPADCTKEELEEVLKDLVYEHEVNFGNAGAKMNLLCVMK
ncbi:MAG: transglutaminase domain-containing protein [Lachnospiraceae bacterium]|nr:transglutaminase domain-containing protein [Lachnospiraceae bacterium]